MELIIQILLNGLQTGAVYVLFAIGLTLIFGVMRIVNFAHGEVFTGAAFVTFFVVTWGAQNTELSRWLLYVVAFALAAIFAALLGAFMYEVLFRRLAGDMIAGLLVAVGASLALQTIYRISFGSAPRRVPSLVAGETQIGDVYITYERLTIVAVAIIVTVALTLYLKYTKIGLALRAVSEDKEAAIMQGINYRKISRNGLMLGAMLAAVAAVLIAPASVVHPVIGVDLLMKGFIIVILGGLGKMVGAIYAGFLLGMLESAAATLINVTFATMLAFVAVVIVLLLRPEGLMPNAQRA